MQHDVAILLVFGGRDCSSSPHTVRSYSKEGLSPYPLTYMSLKISRWMQMWTYSMAEWAERGSDGGETSLSFAEEHMSLSQYMPEQDL